MPRLYWTRFLDGPAAGVTLTLERSPQFLRVVESQTVPPGSLSWDALDQLTDEAQAGETVHAYLRDPLGDGSMHIDRRDERGRRVGEWYQTASYRHYPVQPDDRILRDNRLWAEWVAGEWEKLHPLNEEGAP